MGGLSESVMTKMDVKRYAVVVKNRTVSLTDDKYFAEATAEKIWYVHGVATKVIDQASGDCICEFEV